MACNFITNVKANSHLHNYIKNYIKKKKKTIVEHSVKANKNTFMAQLHFPI